MHFTTLYIMENEKDVSLGYVEQSFGDKYCYACGEREAEVMDYCDWFQVGGRWNNAKIISASKGTKGELSWCCGEQEREINIANIEDLTADLRSECIYSIATENEIIENDSQPERFKELIGKINRKEIKGSIALIDCHD